MDIALLLLTVAITLLLGTIVFMHDKKSQSAQLFSLMSGFVVIWIVANYITNHALDFGLAAGRVANHVAYVSAYLGILCGAIFTYDFPVHRRWPRYEKWSLGVISLVIVGLSCTHLIAGELAFVADGVWFSVGPLLWAYGVGLMMLLGVISRNLVSVYRRRRGIKGQQALAILFSFCISAAMGAFLSVMMPALGAGWDLTRISPLIVVIFTSFIGYTIIRYNTFDVKATVVRTVAYGVSLFMLATIYSVIAYAISQVLFHDETVSSTYINPISIGLALLLVFMFQPIWHFFDRATNKIFYRNRYNKDAFYAELNDVLAETTNLRPLLEKTARLFVRTFTADQGFFLVYRDGRLMTAGSVGHSRMSIRDARWLDEETGAMSPKGFPIVRSELAGVKKNRALSRLMTSYGIELILPLRQRETTIGYVCLGAQHSGALYEARDKLVLNTIAHELVIAIQNTLSIQEVRDVNATLQQRIDEATKELRRSNAQLRRLDEAKDEFVSMASHQLRTPLTSIKGYIDMMLEGDAGEITPMQRQFLTEAFVSSERMVRLINDFLNVSRLQAGTFVIDRRPVDLIKVVQQELDSLKISAEGRDLSFQYKKPASLPKLLLDEDKIRQVIMNFADNALYYSRPGTVIDVSLSVEGKNVTLQVQDTGIGVPKEEQSRLFTKFYRASNARRQRPDGTGVGLYLAKRIIKAHSGSVVFSSVEGKGSTFGFSLPIEALRVRNHTDELGN